MSSWPTNTGLTIANLDAGTDNPSLARGDLAIAVQKLTSVVNARGGANGVASLDASARLPVAQLPAAIPAANLPTPPLVTGLALFNSPGTSSWTVPAGITTIEVEVYGGGGGGGYSPAGDHAGGGGAGGWVRKLWSVTPGATVSIVVGSGGAGAASGPLAVNGGTGGNSSVTIAGSSIVGQGGNGGLATPTNFGGAGGSYTLSGLGNEAGNEGGTAASGASKGGAGGSNSICGAVLTGANAWGGGGGFGSGGAGGNGNNGARGAVIIRW